MEFSARWAEEIEAALVSGCFMGLDSGSSREQVEALFGAPDAVRTKKGETTAVYPAVDFLFEGGTLRQVTLKDPGEPQRVSLLKMREKYPEIPAGEVPPYFRCMELSAGQGAQCRVLITTPFGDTSTVLSVAVVFPAPRTHALQVELPEELYLRLAARSNAARLTVGELCVQAIREMLDAPEEEEQ